MPDARPSSKSKRSLLAKVLPFGLIVAGAGLWWLRSSDDGARPIVLAEIVAPGAAAGFNVLLVTLDTTRPDYLGGYGRKRAETPNLDSLLEHGVRFDDAVTSVSTTLASHATIMTGLYPPSTGVRDNGIYSLAPEFVTLAEMLKGQGYDTGAFVSSFVLERRFGLHQGFDVYDFKTDRSIHRGPASLEHERRANDVTTSAIDWLRARQKAEASAPYLLWIHYFDPHAPYDSPLQPTRSSSLNPYDAEIAFVDRHFGRLLKTIDAQGGRGRTLIVVVSDHGEGLGEHQENLHGIFVYDSTVHVAFVLSNPRLFAEPYRVDDRVVGTVDLAPTLCDLLGLPQPSKTDGQSLLTSPASPDRSIYIETFYPLNLGCSVLRGLRSHTAKYILAPQPEYYDLRRDPHELHNLYDDGGAEVEKLQRALVDLRRQWSTTGTEAQAQRSLTPEEQKRLGALGYVSAPPTAASDSLPDPKERIILVNEMTEVVRLLAEDELENALALSRELIDQAGDWTTPTLMAAEALMRLNRQKERVAVLETYCRRQPTPEMLYYLAHALLATQQYDECARRLAQAESLDPTFGAIPAVRGDLYCAQGRYAEAVKEYEKAIQVDPDRLGDSVLDDLLRAKRHLSTEAP